MDLTSSAAKILISGVFLFIANIILFLVYRKAYRFNSERNTATYPIVNSFYKKVALINALYFIESILIVVNLNVTNEWLNKIAIIFNNTMKTIVIYIGQSCQVLIALLAIRKIFIFFFPDTKQYLMVTEYTLKITTNCILLVFVLGFLALKSGFFGKNANIVSYKIRNSSFKNIFLDGLCTAHRYTPHLCIISNSDSICLSSA